MIEMCVVCYNFQRRWTMQLASLAQQIEPPDFIINVAYVKDNGNPDVETVVNFYEQKGLKFKLTPYEHMGKGRGLIRNRQVQKSSEDWLLFMDCDLIYHPTFFQGIAKHMNPDCQNVIGVPNIAYTRVENVNPFFDNFESMYVESAYDVAKSFGITRTHGQKRKGANGGFQLVRREMVMEKCKGRYVNPKRTGDKQMGHMGTRSDIKFRQAIDGGAYRSKMINTLPVQIHLEHWRKIDEQFNIEAQR